MYFIIWDQSQLYIFTKAWDWSHRSFFFTVGTTRHKSSYGQSHYKYIPLFGISPNSTFLQRPGIDPIGHFSLPSGPLNTKVYKYSPLQMNFTILDQSQQYILQRPGIDHIGHFSLPSGPLDAKVHTHSTMTNLFYIYLYFTKDFTQKYKWSISILIF